MKSKYLVLIVGFIAISVSSCRDKNEDEPTNELPKQPQIELTLEPVYGATPIVMDQTIFTTEEGYQLKLREFKAYFTGIHSTEIQLGEAALFNYENGKKFFTASSSSTGLNSLKMHIGVPQSINHSDPSAFPNDHALNILNANDMHWSWNPGYIFFKIEMIADTLDDGIEQFNHIVSYHVGKDEAIRQVELSNLNWQNIGQLTEQARLKLDLKTFLRNDQSIVDIKTENVTHSAPEEMSLSLKLADNFQAAISPF